MVQMAPHSSSNKIKTLIIMVKLMKVPVKVKRNRRVVAVAPHHLSGHASATSQSHMLLVAVGLRIQVQFQA
jgi:hypothetical protein